MQFKISWLGYNRIIEEGQTLTIGRNPGCDVVIQDNNVSRRHLSLTVMKGQLHIKDLGSSVGTWHHGEKVTELTVNASDSILIGDVAMEIEYVALPVPGVKVEMPSFKQAPKAKIHYDGLGDAFSITLKTWPFLAARLGVMAAFTTVAVLWYAFAFFVVVNPLTKATPAVGLIAGLFILGLPYGLYRFLKHYVLYMLGAAHVAVLTEIMQGKELPVVGQIQYGKDIILKEFKQINVLLVLDGLISSVVNTFNATLDFFSGFLSIPGLRDIARFFKAVLKMSTTYIDEAILSYNLIHKSTNKWASSRDALILYAQNSKAMLGSAVKIVLIDVLTVVPLYLAFYIPVVAFSHFSKNAGLALLAVSFLLTFTFRVALMKPFFLTYMILRFHKETENQQPDPVWQDRLTKVSGQFQEIVRKAGQEMPTAQRTPEQKTAV